MILKDIRERAWQQAKAKASTQYEVALPDDEFVIDGWVSKMMEPIGQTYGPFVVLQHKWKRGLSSTRKMEHMHPLYGSLEASQLQSLIAHIQQLEERLRYLETKDGEPPAAELNRNPFSIWLEANSERLREEYPNKFVAIDIESSQVIAAADDEDEFAKLINNIDPAAHEKIYPLHTSTIK